MCSTDVARRVVRQCRSRFLSVSVIHTRVLWVGPFSCGFLGAERIMRLMNALRKPMCCPCPLQYEMYTIERNAERTASAGRLLYDMYVTRGGLSYQHVLRSFCIHCIKLCYRFVNFPDQPAVWREISVITAALRNDSQDKQTQFLRGKDFTPRIGRVQKEPKDKPSGFIASWASTKSIVW